MKMSSCRMSASCFGLNMSRCLSSRMNYMQKFARRHQCFPFTSFNNIDNIEITLDGSTVVHKQILFRCCYISFASKYYHLPFLARIRCNSVRIDHHWKCDECRYLQNIIAISTCHERWLLLTAGTSVSQYALTVITTWINNYINDMVWDWIVIHSLFGIYTWINTFNKLLGIPLLMFGIKINLLSVKVAHSIDLSWDEGGWHVKPFLLFWVHLQIKCRYMSIMVCLWYPYV